MQTSRSMPPLSRLDKHPSYTTTPFSLAHFNMPIEYLHYHVLHVIPTEATGIRARCTSSSKNCVRAARRRTLRGPGTNIDDVETPQSTRPNRVRDLHKGSVRVVSGLTFTH